MRIVAALCIAFTWLALVGVPGTAAAAEPVPCANSGGGKFTCDWWRAGDGFRGGAMVVNGGRVVGYLPQGKNWILCQARGGRVTNGNHWNNWFGWTIAENNAKGWVSALDAHGGGDDGEFAGVPTCNGSQGPPQSPVPQLCGPWATTPPAPCAPGSTAPAQAPASGPDLHYPYRAGQGITVGGVGCTSGFTIRVGQRVVGLTAGHCNHGSDVNRWGQHWANLGTVVDDSSRQGVDTLIFGEGNSFLVPWRQEIERGRQAPTPIIGLLRSDQQRVGAPACLAGITSGYDKCGTITTGVIDIVVEGRHRKLICTDIIVRPGDSGGPVYQYLRISKFPRRAVALGVTDVGRNGRMCYTPIDQALRALHADSRLPGIAS